jgi:hypothetical protein
LNDSPYDYPKDFFIPFENDLYKEGRLIINFLEKDYSVEIDIVQKDSRKIYYHIGLLTKIESEQEAIEAGIFKLKSFFANIESII